MKIIKALKIFLIILLSIVTGITILNILPFTFSRVKGNNEFRKKGDIPLIIPHGGAKLLAPENTIYSFDELNSLGVDVLEIDLVLTSDNELISHHNLDLEMSPNSSYNGSLIKEMTYEELKSAYYQDDYYLARNFVNENGGKPFENVDKALLSNMVPARLKEDIFEKYKDSNYLYMLEIKDTKLSKNYDENIHDVNIAAKTLVDLIVSYKLERRVVIGSFDDEAISAIKSYNKDIIVGAGMGEATKFSLLSAFYVDTFFKVNSEVMILPNLASMKIPNNLVSNVNMLPSFIRNNIATELDGSLRANLTNKQLIKDAHRKNIAVIYWTVNDEEEMEMLIKNGADGIITDRPDKLIDVIKKIKKDN